MCDEGRGIFDLVVSVLNVMCEPWKISQNRRNWLPLKRFSSFMKRIDMKRFLFFLFFLKQHNMSRKQPKYWPTSASRWFLMISPSSKWPDMTATWVNGITIIYLTCYLFFFKPTKDSYAVDHYLKGCLAAVVLCLFVGSSVEQNSYRAFLIHLKLLWSGHSAKVNGLNDDAKKRTLLYKAHMCKAVFPDAFWEVESAP